MPVRPLLLLSFGAFWTVTLEMLPAGLLPSMSADLGVSPPRIGLLVTLWALTVGLSSVPLSRATRAWGRPRVLATALAVLGASTVLTALAPGYGAVAATRLVAAAGHGLFWSVLMVYAASIAPEGRSGRAVSIVLGGPLLANVVGLPLGTALAAPWGWRSVVGVVGAVMVVGAVLLRRLPEIPVPSGAPGTAGGRRDATAPLVISGALLGALALLAHFAVFTFVSELVTGAWALESGDLGRLLLVFGGTGAVGLLVSGALPDRSAQHCLVGVVLALSGTFALLAAVRGPVAVLTLVAGWGLLLGMLPPLLQSRVIGVASPDYRDAAGAILVTVFNLGIAAGALAGGQVIQRLGLSLLLPLAAAVTATSAIGLVALMRRAGS
jgi:predicted MFS family arabinose efflux permease